MKVCWTQGKNLCQNVSIKISLSCLGWKIRLGAQHRGILSHSMLVTWLNMLRHTWWFFGKHLFSLGIHWCCNPTLILTIWFVLNCLQIYCYDKKERKNNIIVKKGIVCGVFWVGGFCPFFIFRSLKMARLSLYLQNRASDFDDFCTDAIDSCPEWFGTSAMC